MEYWAFPLISRELQKAQTIFDDNRIQMSSLQAMADFIGPAVLVADLIDKKKQL